MYDATVITDEDPLGPVATLPTTSFGAREAALAGVGRGMTANDGDQLPAAMLTWHITCSSITFTSGDQT